MTIVDVTASQATGRAPGSAPYRSRDPEPLARAVVVWVWILTAASLLAGLASAALALGVVRGDTGDLVLLATSLPEFVLTLVAGFLSLKWCYRVQMNAHTLSSGLSNTPPWAVGWFFVPIALLFKPFQAVKEAWQSALAPEAWRSGRPPAVLGWWWALWIISGIVGNLAFRLGFDADLAREIGDGVHWINVAGAALGIPANVLFIGLVRGLSADQASALRNSTFG